MLRGDVRTELRAGSAERGLRTLTPGIEPSKQSGLWPGGPGGGRMTGSPSDSKVSRARLRIDGVGLVRLVARRGRPDRVSFGCLRWLGKLKEFRNALLNFGQLKCQIGLHLGVGGHDVLLGARIENQLAEFPNAKER